MGKIEEEKIQSKFSFKIPEYILSEIVEDKNGCRKENINALINLAIINNRLTIENGNILKKAFVL